MVGRLEIQLLRRHAEQQLGERFKIGDFRNVVLGNGMTPLNQLAAIRHAASVNNEMCRTALARTASGSSRPIY